MSLTPQLPAAVIARAKKVRAWACEIGADIADFVIKYHPDANEATINDLLDAADESMRDHLLGGGVPHSIIAYVLVGLADSFASRLEALDLAKSADGGSDCR